MMASDFIVSVTEADFEFQVIAYSRQAPVVVDFWAEWCGPCRMAGPVLEELSDTYKEKVIVYKLNVDKNQINPQKYGVQSIPTTILFKEGQEIGRETGFTGKNTFEELIKKAI